MNIPTLILGIILIILGIILALKRREQDKEQGETLESVRSINNTVDKMIATVDRITAKVTKATEESRRRRSK